MIDDIRRNIMLIEEAETYITQSNVLNVEMSPYEFSVLMRDYRATDPTYNKIGDNAMVAFYSDEEREDFKKFLSSRGVKFSQESGGRPM